MYRRIAPPGATGLYDPANEHDGCGIALVAKLWGEASHAVVEKALDALENLEHRGAEGADPNTGDGAGILLQIPDGFLRAAVAGVELPPAGRYGVNLRTVAKWRSRKSVADLRTGPKEARSTVLTVEEEGSSSPSGGTPCCRSTTASTLYSRPSRI